MRLASLTARLIAAEKAILDALAAAATALRPGVDQLAVAYGEYAEFGMPRQLTSLLDTLVGNDHAAVVDEMRERSFQVLLKEAAKVYARPGLTITIKEDQVLDAVATKGDRRRHASQRELVDLNAVAAYLERTYGEGAGERVAVQQLRAYLKRELDEAPPTRTARAVVVTMRMYPNPYHSGAAEYDYSCRDRAKAVADALTRALALLGLHAADHDLLRTVTMVTTGTIDSRLRQPCGAGVAVVTFQRKLQFELPIGVGTEFLAWLDAVETNVAT